MITADNINLSIRMRDARKRAGLKQTDLTHIASRSQIGRIERGEVYSPETIDAWADACKVSREWLRTGKEAAIVPPKLGDKWGDLTPEQRAMVPVGSEVTYPVNGYKYVKTAPDTWGDPPAHDNDNDIADGAWYSLGPDLVLTRLGPAPAETPAEPDRARLPDESEAPQPAPDQRDAEIATLRGIVDDIAEVMDGRTKGATLQFCRLLVDQVRLQKRRWENEIAALTRRAEDAEREVAALRAVVREAREACDAAGVTDGITPAERIGVLSERIKRRECLLASMNKDRDEWKARAESAEATLDAYRIQRDQAREDAAGVRRLLSDAADLRAAAAEACDCDDGEVPADAELARRLRELSREPQDLALVRKVVAHNAAAIRRLLNEVAPGWQVAGETAIGNIELCVGVERG